MSGKGVLIFFCGKMGAGKSTLSCRIAAERNAVLISEDEWLESLYPDQIGSFEDYLKFSARIKPLLKKHVTDILNAGTSVVMDFPANTLKQREWFSELLAEANCSHELIYVNVSDELCLRQIAQRRIEQPERATFDTEETFHRLTRYFQAPLETEGFNLVVMTRNV